MRATDRRYHIQHVAVVFFSRNCSTIEFIIDDNTRPFIMIRCRWQTIVVIVVVGLLNIFSVVCLWQIEMDDHYSEIDSWKNSTHIKRLNSILRTINNQVSNKNHSVHWTDQFLLWKLCNFIWFWLNKSPPKIF